MNTTHQTYLLPLVALGLALLTQSAVAQEEIDKNAQMSPTGRVSVTNVAGRVAVEGWDRAELKLTGRLSEKVKRLEFDADGDDVRIEVVYHKGKKNHGWGWNSEKNRTVLKLRVPKDSRLSVDTVSADIEIDDHFGPQNIESVSGDIEMRLGHNDADIESVSGDITLRGRDESIELHISAVSGDIDVRDFVGDIDADAVSGDIEISSSTVGDVSIEAVSGDIEFDSLLEDRGDLEIETVSGDVSLRFHGNTSAEVRMNSHSGSIDDFFGQESKKVNKYGPGRRLKATAGNGDGDVSISTLSGDIQNRGRN